MRDQKKKLPISKIGRRTGTDVLEGKLVRQNTDGVDNFNDYFTDQESVCSDQTSYSMASSIKSRSEWTSLTDNSIVTPVKSYLKKTLNKNSEESDGDFSNAFSDHSMNPKISKKKSLAFQENSENVNFTMSKMTQTSQFLNEASLHSRNRTYLQEINNDLSDIKKNSTIAKSNILSNTSITPNIIQDIPLSSNVMNAALVSSSHEKPNKIYKSNENETASLLYNSEKSMQTSYLREASRKKKYSSDLSHNIEKGKRNVSGKRSQNIADSSELLKLRENDMLNRSEILMFPEEDCNVKDGRRKSSSKKSPIALKRKIHMFETMCVQNGRDDSNKTNSSEERSHQYVPNSSEMLKLKENISLKKSNVLNRSESLMSPEKESEENNERQKSFLRKSPRKMHTSETPCVQNGMDDSNKTNSEERFHQYVSNSSEILKLKENMSSKKSNILNRSESLMSPDKESEEKNERQKSLLRKSQRKMHTSETPCVQNRTDDCNKINSENRSHQYVANSSKALKLKENISLKRDYNENTLGSFTSSVKKRKEKDDRRKSCLGKSPTTLGKEMQVSETPFIQNRRDDSNEIYPSEKRSRHVANSSEILEVKENKSLCNDKSVNKPESLISSQKENKKKEKREKSHVEVKKKLQTSHEVEEIQSETTYVQKGGDNSKQRNSRGLSFQLAAISSEVSKSKENISLRNKEIENESEIFVSRKKENDQNSSARKSESNVIESPNNSKSQKKAVRTLPTPKQKIDFSKITEDIHPKNEQSPCAVRRSSRRRFPPLASWRNERPMYKKSTSGNITCVGIDEGRPEDDFAFRNLIKKYERQREQRLKASQKRKQDLVKLIKNTTIFDAKNQRKVKLNLHRPFSTCEWTFQTNADSQGYKVSTVFSSKILSYGFLEIAAHSMKDQRYSPTDNAHFVVLKGVVDAVIGTTSFTFKKFDSFIVPLHTMYCISNNASSSALLHFCTFKVPFFNYQESD